MNNYAVTDLGQGKTRTLVSNAAAIETPNARFDQVGAFRVAALAASQAGVAETFQAVDAAAPNAVVAGRAGHIIGLVWQTSAAVTAGTGVVNATIAGTIVGDNVNFAAALKGTQDFVKPVAFNKGDSLGVKHTTNSGYLPTTLNVSTWLLIRWSPILDPSAALPG